MTKTTAPKNRTDEMDRVREAHMCQNIKAAELALWAGDHVRAHRAMMLALISDAHYRRDAEGQETDEDPHPWMSIEDVDLNGSRDPLDERHARAEGRVRALRPLFDQVRERWGDRCASYHLREPKFLARLGARSALWKSARDAGAGYEFCDRVADGARISVRLVAA